MRLVLVCVARYSLSIPFGSRVSGIPTKSTSRHEDSHQEVTAAVKRYQTRTRVECNGRFRVSVLDVSHLYDRRAQQEREPLPLVVVAFALGFAQIVGALTARVEDQSEHLRTTEDCVARLLRMFEKVTNEFVQRPFSVRLTRFRGWFIFRSTT